MQTILSLIESRQNGLTNTICLLQIKDTLRKTLAKASVFLCYLLCVISYQFREYRLHRRSPVFLRIPFLTRDTSSL